MTDEQGGWTPKHVAEVLRRQAVAIYVGVAILTFGAAASENRSCVDVDTGETFRCGRGQNALAGFLAGSAWPLYWSWALAAMARGDQ